MKKTIGAFILVWGRGPKGHGSPLQSPREMDTSGPQHGPDALQISQKDHEEFGRHPEATKL